MGGCNPIFCWLGPIPNFMDYNIYFNWDHATHFIYCCYDWSIIYMNKNMLVRCLFVEWFYSKSDAFSSNIFIWSSFSVMPYWPNMFQNYMIHPIHIMKHQYIQVDGFPSIIYEILSCHHKISNLLCPSSTIVLSRFPLKAFKFFIFALSRDPHSEVLPFSHQ